MPDLDTRSDREQREQHEQVAPVRRQMEVGAADDHAELDADRRADAALSRLAGLEPVGLAGPAEQEQHVHSAACGISRSHAPAADATIGYEGGALDAGTQSEIERAVGGGERLDAPLRSAMEGAFGRDLGKVRIHRDDRAARISRKISAEAFTTGNDVFFGAGAYDPGSAKGQRVLAHELGHVVQGGGSVHRLWNPFKKKDAAPKEGPLSRADTAKQNRKDMEAEDKAARKEAKLVNADHKALTKSIKLSYEADPTSKLFTPKDLVQLQAQFENRLKLERAVRAAVARDNATLTGAELEEKQDEAAEAVWASASPEVRALRPLRFDQFDKALNEVAELSRQGKEEKVGQSSKLLADNEESYGAHMTPEKAEKKLKEQRELERRKARVQEKQSEEQKKEFADKSTQKGQDAVLKTGNGMVGPGQDKTVRKDAARKADEEEFGKDEDLESARSALSTGGTVVNGLGMATKGGTEGLIKQKMVTKAADTDVASVVGASGAGLGQLLTMVSDVLKFVQQIGDIRQGTADKGAGVQAARQGVTILTDATKLTKTTLETAQAGVKAFGGLQSVVGQTTTAIPIVGLITAALGAIDSALQLMPILDRHAIGVVSVEEALVSRKAPLAASYDRINSRTAQLIEKSAWSLGKNLTNLGLSIGEVASAGGMGVPAAAKTAVTIVDLLHTVGHKIYDTVMESKASTALTDRNVKHKESASRDVLKFDVGSSVDVIIVAAKKHQLPYAIMTLEEYGITASEVKSMWLEEIREKVLDHLDTTGDPKTVGQKVTAAKDSVASALGSEKEPVGMEKSTLEKIKGAPGAVASAIKGLPGKISAKYQSMKDNWADAKQLVDAKNKTYTSGRDDRGTKSTLFYALRDKEKNEKSLAKTRVIMADRGTAAKDLPRSTEDRQRRAELEVARDTSPDDRIGRPVPLDPAFVKQVLSAPNDELFQVLAKINTTSPTPQELAKMKFLELEVQARIQARG
ncbi:eCIS core domain-containing protein [Nocardioides flavescens]|uniref:eCIS core domain-containing protein n=1 Tax=Nocardioides flavescens TaxID=2691959 RepID=UPI0019279AA0|nr:DUF4157 domain-containing protein [Nocardioides flavescens]